MLEIFHLAQERELDLHPQALAAVTNHLARIDQKVREDPEANRLFLDMLCSRKDPALTLTRMNETGLLGRFIPDFGRIVAQMQHNLYHVYTVDEHTIRAIGILSQIENGQLADELPISTEVMPKLLSRRELYVAVFLHDIAKGRGGDHSELGEEIAKRLCPRLGLPDDATETVAWLVRHHLVMSRFAFKRDSEDPQTIQDFVAIVQSPERLKLLLLLTATDIRAVGPNVWNGWKGQLLRELYQEAAAAMATGDPQGRRAAPDRARQAEARRSAGGAAGAAPGRRPRSSAYLARHDPRYWLGSADRRASAPCADRGPGRCRARAAGGRLPHRRVPRAHRDAALRGRPSRPVHEGGGRPGAVGRQHRRRAHLHHRRRHGAGHAGLPGRRRPGSPSPTRRGWAASATTPRRRCAARSGSRRRWPGGAACPSAPTCSRSSRAC